MTTPGDGTPDAPSHDPGRCRRYRVSVALAALAMPLTGLTLLGRYRQGVLEKVPDAPPGALKAGVWAAWLFGSALNTLAVLLLVIAAGVVGATACRLAGTRGGFAADRSAGGTAVALFLASKSALLATSALLVGVPARDGLVTAIGRPDLGLAVLALACTVALRRSAGLSWPRSTLCAAAPTLLYVALSLLPH